MELIRSILDDHESWWTDRLRLIWIQMIAFISCDRKWGDRTHVDRYWWHEIKVLEWNVNGCKNMIASQNKLFQGLDKNLIAKDISFLTYCGGVLKKKWSIVSDKITAYKVLYDDNKVSGVRIVVHSTIVLFTANRRDPKGYELTNHISRYWFVAIDALRSHHDPENTNYSCRTSNVSATEWSWVQLSFWSERKWSNSIRQTHHSVQITSHGTPGFLIGSLHQHDFLSFHFRIYNTLIHKHFPLSHPISMMQIIFSTRYQL